MAPSFLTLLLAGSAAAQTTLELLVPPAGPIPLQGSIIAADESLTTVAVNCPRSASPEECVLGDRTWTITQGPSSWAMVTSTVDPAFGTFYYSAECSLDFPNDEARCTGQVAENGVTTSATEQDAMPFRSIMAEVAITAGGDKLPEVEATSTSSPSSTTETASPETSASETITSTETTESSAVSTSATTVTTASLSSSTSSSPATPTPSGDPENDAGRMATHNALLVCIGAVVGGILML